MYKILLQLHNEGDMVMFQSFMKLRLQLRCFFSIYYNTNLLLQICLKENLSKDFFFPTITYAFKNNSY